MQFSCVPAVKPYVSNKTARTKDVEQRLHLNESRFTILPAPGRAPIEAHMRPRLGRTMTFMHQQRRIGDITFLLLAVAAGIATFVDIESTVHAQCDPDAVEMNSWIYGERPRRALMYAINVPVTGALTCLAYSWKTRHSQHSERRVWCAPLVILGIGHGAAAIFNYFNFRDVRRTRASCGR